ncbi:MAG: HAD-IIIA family hydrolase [Candidatus Omnitrophota bacterium]
MPGRKNAVFFDKDGTIIKDVPYNVDKSKIIFDDHLFSSLHLIQKMNFLLIIVSNQPGIAKGEYTSDDVNEVGSYLMQQLHEKGIVLNGFYYCPHQASSGKQLECFCHKPREGLLLQASLDHSIDLRQSWMIGDILDDVEAGNRAGCRTIFINNGNETEWKMNRLREPEFYADSLLAAAFYIQQNRR